MISMKRISKILLLIVLALSNLLFLNLTADEINYEVTGPQVKGLCSFLELQYIHEAGLLRAATTVEPERERIYIASDNLLAARALTLLGSKLGVKILTVLSQKYSFGFNCRHEVILGFNIPDEFYALRQEKIGEVYSTALGLKFEILYEKPDKSRIIYDWREYVDLTIYRALDYIIEGRISEAEELFRNILSAWDGNGFRDKAQKESGRYETYKIALALYLYRVLIEVNGKCPIETETINKWYTILRRMQTVNGGIVTHYVVRNEVIEPLGDANTETTSITAIALSNLPSLFSRNSKLYLLQIDVITDSDWTSVNFPNGPIIIAYNGSILTGGNASELKYYFDNMRVWISKKTYDTTKVTLRITGIAIRGSNLGGIVIMKGHIGVTEVVLRFWDGGGFIYYSSVRHEGINQSDPVSNPRFFTINYDFLYAKPVGTALRESIPLAMQKKVCAFYYPWYGNARGPSRCFFHWEGVDVDSIGSSTHYPMLGPYDSYDEKVIETHMLLAKSSGIDYFIVSWWGIDTFEDKVFHSLLNVGEQLGFNITIYYESYRGLSPLLDPTQIVNELSYVVRNYASSPAFLKVNSRPVIFIYAVEAYGRDPDFWFKVRRSLEEHVGPVYLVGDLRDPRYIHVFDAFHTYIELNLNVMEDVFKTYRQKMSIGLKDLDLNQAINIILSKGNPTIQEKALCFTVVPGYDDRKIRYPGALLDRRNGETYKAYWQKALKADPDLILITSWNEWHEGTEIEPSREYGFTYLQLTAIYTAQFKKTSLPYIEKPKLILKYLPRIDNGTLSLNISSQDYTAFIITIKIILNSSLEASYMEGYLTSTIRQDNLDVITVVFPVLKSGESVTMRFQLRRHLPDTVNIKETTVEYYSANGERFKQEVGEEYYHRLTVRGPSDLAITIFGQLYIARNGNINLWMRRQAVEVHVLSEVIQISDNERLRFTGWSDGNVESRRIVKLEKPLTLETIYQRQFRLIFEDTYNIILIPSSMEENWYVENSNVNISVKAIQYINNSTRKVLTSYFINDVEHSVSTQEDLFIIRIVIDQAVKLKFKYVTQYFIKGYSKFSRVLGEGWYPEGSEAILSVDNDSVPMEGLLGLIGGTYNADSKTKRLRVTGPMEAHFAWTPNYRLPTTISLFAIGLSIGILSLLIVRRHRKRTSSTDS